MSSSVIGEKQSVKDILKNGPEFVNDTALDRFFEQINNDLFKPLIELQKQEGNKLTAFEYLKFANNHEFVSKLLDYLDTLHSLVLENQIKITENGTELLPISLHDMRYVDSLINLILIHGIDTNIFSDMRIPMDAKRLTQFKEDDKRYEIPHDYVIRPQILRLVIDRMCNILLDTRNNKEKDDYLRSIIIKGPAFTNIFLGTLALIILKEDRFKSKLNKLEDIQETYKLFSMYTLLNETVANKAVKVRVIEKLSTLVIRRENDGLLSLIDFILGVRENEDIDEEKMNRINQIILSRPPSKISNLEYLKKLFEQIYDALTYTNRPIVVTCVNNIIRSFSSRNKRILRDFLFKPIYEVLLNRPMKDHSVKELNDVINVVISLSKNPDPEVIHDLVSFVDKKIFFITLWTYALFLKKNQKIDPLVANNVRKDNIGPYYEVILSLMKSLLFILDDYEILDYLSCSLLTSGHEGWEYKIDLESQLPYINVVDKKMSGELLNLTASSASVTGDKMNKMSVLFQDMDISIDLFMEFLKLLDNEEYIKDLFLGALKRWVKQTINESESGDNKQSLISESEEAQNRNLRILSDLKLLEKMNDNFKSGLVRSVKDILEVIDDLLDMYLNERKKSISEDSDKDSDDDEDDSDDEEYESSDEANANMNPLDFILELFNMIVDRTASGVLHQNKPLLLQISDKLEKAKTTAAITTVTTLNLVLQKIETDSKNDPAYIDNDNDEHERLDKALRNVSDPLVPIKVHGLMELRQFVESGSTIIATDRVIKLHLQYLKNPDPFIYLNVIKGLSSLCQYQPDTTLVTLVDFYRDIKQRNKMDDILKVGEVFINYIQIENELFQGEYANMIIDICLEKIQKHSKIDNRLRMSAMSILGVSLQVNAKGISSRITEMLDCVFGILQLERATPDSTKTGSVKDDTFLMRRSAVRLVYDLFYNFDSTFLPEKYSIERIITLLEYVKQKDNDYLVCEQIDQVIKTINGIVPESKLMELNLGD